MSAKILNIGQLFILKLIIIYIVNVYGIKLSYELKSAKEQIHWCLFNLTPNFELKTCEVQKYSRTFNLY